MSLISYPLHYTCGNGKYFIAEKLAQGSVRLFAGVRTADQRPVLITFVAPFHRDRTIAAIQGEVPGVARLLDIAQVDPGSWQPQPGDDRETPSADTEDDINQEFMLVVETRPRGCALRSVGPVAARRAVAVGAGLVQVAAVARERGICLNGLRPETVYENDGQFAGCQPRLWQLAQSTISSRRFTDLFPLGGFVAPELLWSDPPTATSDAFSAAAVLWWFATGCDPFGDPDDQHQRTIDGQLEPFSGPSELGEILVPMLARDPAARPSAAESADRLAALARRWDVPIAPFPPPGLDQ